MNGMKWDGTEPLGMSISQLLYRMRANDVNDGLLFDSITMHDILSASGVQLMAFDALTVPYGKLKKKMEQLQVVMSAASSQLDVVAFQLSDKFKRAGVLQTACVFELSDGQTVSVFLHNPDSTPSSILDTDVMISWKWMLNKKDVTIVVAPERGKDLPAKTVAVRLMKLAEKNSATFVKNNAKRAEKLSRIEELRAQVAELETTLKTKKAKSKNLEDEIIERKASRSISSNRKGKGNGKTITEMRTQDPTNGDEKDLITPRGTKIKASFKVVEAEKLTASHDIEGNLNPAYPQELQPRDRSRKESIAALKKMAKNIDPQNLMASYKTDTGAPIIGADMVVESGNGRVIALKEAYRTGNADEYKQALIDNAESFGIRAGVIEAMKAPVLVRVRKTDMNRVEFAKESNQDDKLAMSDTELARSDAQRIDMALLSKLDGESELSSASNAEFISGFLALLGDQEAASYRNTMGGFTPSAIRRAQNALFSKAYDNDQLTELLADTQSPDSKNIITALNAAAPDFAYARELNEAFAGNAIDGVANATILSLDKEMIGTLLQAVNVIRGVKARGESVDAYLAQQNLFGEIDPNIAAMAVFISENSRSSKLLSQAFKAMAAVVRNEADRQVTNDIFGSPPATIRDVIEAANRALTQSGAKGIEVMANPEPQPEPQPITPLAPEEPVLITPTEITPQPEPEPIAHPEPVTQPEQAQPDDFEQWVSENFGGESMFELSKERDPSLEGDARLLLKVKKESIPTKDIAASDLWDNYYQAAIKRYKEDGALGKLSSESVDAVSGALLKTVTAEFDGFYN